MTGVGDCFEAALSFVMTVPDDELPSYRVCNGEPIGQGAIEGVRHAHAWVEHTVEVTWPGIEGYKFPLVTVIDRSNGKDVSMLAQLYYKLGQIEPDEVVRYEVADARRMAVRHGHWGPWAAHTVQHLGPS